MISPLKNIGLPKKKNIGIKYGSFNRRMLAATLDSLLVVMLTGPLIEIILNSIYGVPPVGLDTLINLAQQHAGDQDAINKALAQMSTGSGYMERGIVDSLLQLIMFCGYSGICWHYWSTTPGKMLVRLKIVDEKTGAAITDRQIGYRLGGYILSGLCFMAGFFWIGWNKRHQGWHDKLAGTVVIVKPRRAAKPGSEAVGPSGSPVP